MSDEGEPREGVEADDDVLFGYPSSRVSDPRLVVGPGARLRSGTVVYVGSRIGRRLETGHHVVIREENVIGDDVCIWSNTVVDYGCVIGDRVKIHSNCYIAQFTEIEDDVFFAPGVTVANDLYPGSHASARLMRGPSVGAGSVVTRDIPDGMLAYGAPAVAVRELLTIPIDDRVHERASGWMYGRHEMAASGKGRNDRE